MRHAFSKTFLSVGLCLMLQVLCACVTSRPMHGPYGKEDPTRPVAIQWESVKVRPGDTLAKLATRGGVSLQKIAERNRRGERDPLRPGEMVFAPRVTRVRVMHPASETPLPPRKALALRWPVAGVLTSPYGKRWGRMHDGIDIGATQGSAIHAAADGQVLFAGPQRGYGNLVIVRHRCQVTTVYAHAHRTLVRVGQPVSAGQTIALVGQTGHATGPHLHFEVRHGIRPVDPHRLLPLPALAFNEVR